MTISDVLMIVLGGICFIALIALIIQLFKIKVWVFSKGRLNPRLLKIGYLSRGDDFEVPEVHLTDSAKGPAIGRIKQGEGKDLEKTFIELLTTDADDESVKPQYRTYAYLTPEGLIYKVQEKRKKPEIIGYTARPSQPTVATIHGERSWKDLWLTCRLNAYLGIPQPPEPEPEPEPEPQTAPEPEPEQTPQPEPEQEPQPDTSPTPQPEITETSEQPETSEESDNNSEESENIVEESDDNSDESEDISEESDDNSEESDDNSDESEDNFEESEDNTDVSEDNSDESEESSEEVGENAEESDENPEESDESKETPASQDASNDEPPLRLAKKASKKDDKKSKKPAKPVGPEVIARAAFTGLRSGNSDALTPEAQAAAYGLVFRLYNKRNYQEHYSSPAYGWKDTALLAAFIYAVLYVIWYIFNVKVLGLRFIGYKFWQDFPLFFSYFAIWAIVRAIKIECIERSDTIQPKIDLFNKILGQRGYDILIIVCCIITIAFSGKYYRFDFLPLACVLITGICINLSLKASKKPWIITNPYVTEEEADDDDQIANPPGDIERKYQWQLETNKDIEAQLELYFDAQYIQDLRFMNPFFNQRQDKSIAALIKDMFIYVATHKSVSARSRYIVSRIKDFAAQKFLTQEETLQFILDFVQEPNIRFVMNRDSSSINKFEDYIRYPDEVLYDKEGDSNSKAFLAAMLVYYFGRKVLFLHSRLQQHGAIGIEIYPHWRDYKYLFGKKFEDATFIYNGVTYIFCETTSDGFRIGGALEGMKPEDFNDKVEFQLPKDEEENEEEAHRQSSSRLYKWDLDSETDATLQGVYTLEFDDDEIETLRDNNPFRNYGKDGASYEDNVRKMFAYLDADPSRKAKVKEIADYIKKVTAKAELNDLDRIQFALDFCQAPNIDYKIDEECDELPYDPDVKEYMRYPDEVLFDKRGDCDCKSSLTAALFRELGFKSVFLMSEKLKHAAIAVQYNPEWKDIIKDLDEDKVVRNFNGTEYIYCETTGDGLRVGGIKEGDSILDFETVIEI